jgi:hypothetical protein
MVCTKINRNMFLSFGDGTCSQGSCSIRRCALDITIQFGENRRLWTVIHAYQRPGGACYSRLP